MYIKNRKISDNNLPLIIAEIGINHNGSLIEAKKLVKLAKDSGCECVKHQTHIIDDEMTELAKKIQPPNADKSIWDIMKECALTKDEEVELKNYAESLGLIYLSTPFSREAANFLNEIDIPAFKIGSGECNHLPLIEHICSFKKPIILSTGMNDLETVSKSVEIIRKHKLDYALLQCTNIYPSPPETISLKGIKLLKEKFKDAVVGYSDHSIGPEMCLAAVALGSSIIERHFTDDFYRKGPDISCSMDPLELKYLIKFSQNIFQALNNPKKRHTKEKPTFNFARSSIVADQDIKKGDRLTKKNIWARRPGNGEISVESYFELLGKKTKKNIKKGKFLSWTDIE